MMKPREAAPVRTEEAYLNRLGRKLLHYFPVGQVREILEDYQGHFSLGRERGSTDADMIAALGTPEAVTKAILKEMPEGWSYRLRRTAGWGALFLFACFFLFLRYTDAGWAFFNNTASEAGSCVLLLLSAAAMFALLRGRELAAVEGRFWRASLRPGIAAPPSASSLPRSTLWERCCLSGRSNGFFTVWMFQLLLRRSAVC